MTRTAINRVILMHRVPGDSVRNAVADALRRSTYEPNLAFGVAVLSAARNLGISKADVLAAVGLQEESQVSCNVFIPDGVRACYRDQCQHGPDYTPPKAGSHDQEGTP
jgi:hypothetical protein